MPIATMTKAKTAAPCSHEEYDALPEQLKRKCFSTVERLRIEEELAHPQLHQPAPARSRAASLSLSLHSKKRRASKPKTLKDNHLALHADAEFFLSLPDKVRRLHFTREEQIILVGSYNPQASFSSPLPESRSQRALDDSSHANNNHFADFHFDFNNDNSQPRRRSTSPSSSLSSLDPITPAQASFYQPHFLSAKHHHQLDAMSFSSHARPSSSYRRTLSLTHLPHRTSTSSAPPIDSHLSNRVSIWHQRSHSHSLSGRRSSSHIPQAPVFDPEATHWKDPEARKKLRTLASPQKFDEAVEFGFAPTTDRDHRAAQTHYQLPPIATDARNFSRDVQTFLKDDRISFLEDHDDDEDGEDDRGLESDVDSVADLDSPVTPSSGLSFRCHTRHQSSNFSSIDSNGLPAHAPINTRPTREMTLRMTLTRPDLRADEEQLYGWQSLQANKSHNPDPFALEELQLTDDMTGTKGPFYVKPKSHGNLVSRLFKRGSKKSR